MKTPEEIPNDCLCSAPQCQSCSDHDAAVFAAAIREAEVRGATWGLDAAKAAHNAAKGACESRDCCEGITTIALRSLDPAAIVAERTPGLAGDGKDRKATGELSDPPKPFVTLLGANPTFPLSSSEIGPHLRGKRTPAPAPACARCGGSGKIVVREWQTIGASGVYEWHVERTACPACRGKP